jgi:uncharacterized protein (TIGR02594 family)
MSEPRWLQTARKYLGVKEGPGEANNPIVVRMYAEAGFPGVRHDATPWCAAFCGAVLKEAGLKPSGSLLARSYERWGQPLAGPVVGAVAVKTRVGGGHVGFVVGSAPGTVTLLGGNQGDQVRLATFPRSGFTAFRWPPGEPLPTAHPAPNVPAPKGRRKLSYHRGGQNG